MTVTRGLHRLAYAQGVQTAYYDMGGKRVRASADALLATLNALGVPLRHPDDADEALRLLRLDQLRQPVDPVIVAWDGATGPISLRAPNGAASVRVTIQHESGKLRQLDVVPTSQETRELEGERTTELRLPALTDIPSGYHTLRFEAGATYASSQLIAAPRRADTRAVARRSWGVFLPTFALRDEGDWGCGDLSELGRVVDWVADRGGRAVSTLPLLASFLGGHPHEPSPYSPASRLAWNELYVDPTLEPEWSAAGSISDDPGWQAERAALSNLPWLEYDRLGELRRALLGAMAEALFRTGGPRRAALEAFLDARPELREYARFRAVVETRGEPWPCWPERLATGDIRDADLDPAAYRYHAYAQFVTHGQLARLASNARSRDVAIVLDLPLGVHADGFDTWRHPTLFAGGVSVGAPPDAFFTQGQDWGFPPPQSAAMRAEGYRYFAATLRHHLEHAGLLRVDHILGLHRLYWIPRGMGPKQGVYVRRHHEELYAVVCLESARSGVTIAGEDLGTVPRNVRPAMGRHGLQRLHVMQFSIGGGEPGPGRSPLASVAGLNTHDLPSFAAFHDGLDIDDFRALGLYDAAGARQAREAREALMADLRTWLEGQGLLTPGADLATLMRACLSQLARSPAPLVLVNLEDLWLETLPVNVPGTHRERPNWRRRARHALSTFTQLPEVLEALARVDELRRRPAVTRRRVPAIPGVSRMVTRLSDMDVELAIAGHHEELAGRLGSQPHVHEGVTGVHFGVWAPDAAAVSVVGTFDDWDPARHPLQARGGPGLFEGFVPGARRGMLYKYRVTRPDGSVHDRPDPVAHRSESAPGNASRVWSLEYEWGDKAWTARPPDGRPLRLATARPTFGPLDARQLVDELFNAARLTQAKGVVLPPLMDARVSQLVTGAFASAIVPQDLMRLVSGLHRRGQAAWMTWPAPSERNHGSHDGPWSGPVASLVASSASFWLSTFHVDGLIIDVEGVLDLASLLSRAVGEVDGVTERPVDRAQLLAHIGSLGRRHPRARLLPAVEAPPIIVA